MKKILFIIFCIIIIFVSCSNKKYYYIKGFIQGTTFHIKYEHTKNLSNEIDFLLQLFNTYFSNYDSTSLISRINRNETDTLNEILEKLLNESFKINYITDGAFDITVAPLANLWNFGWKKSEQIVPDSAKIDSVLKYVGMNKISIKNHRLIKENENTTIIVNAIAQGLSSDFIADYFNSLGITNYLVEIGGEVFCKGVNSSGKEWNVGIEKPINNDLEINESKLIVKLSNKSICTSGNYRKFVEFEGKKYGHELDPKTGYPAKNSLLSVSVISNSAMYSDAMATAFMVLGLEKSMKITDSIPELEACFIYSDTITNTEKIAFSKNFAKYIKNP